MSPELISTRLGACAVTHKWTQMCDHTFMNFVFPISAVQLTRVSISGGKRKITVHTLPLPLSCPLVCRQLWFVVIHHGRPSDTDKALLWNGKWLFVFVCDCRGARRPPDAAALSTDKSTLFWTHTSDRWSRYPRETFATRRLVCTNYIYYTHIFMFSLSLMNGMDIIIAALPCFSTVEPVSVPSIFFSSPHGHPCLLICRLFKIFIRWCKEKTKNMQHVVKLQMNIPYKMQYINLLRETPVGPALKQQ